MSECPDSYSSYDRYHKLTWERACNARILFIFAWIEIRIIAVIRGKFFCESTKHKHLSFRSSRHTKNTFPRLSRHLVSQNRLADHSVCLKCSKTFPQVSSIVTRPLGLTKMYVMYVCMCVQPTISAVGHVVYNARLNRIVGDKWHGSSKLDFGIMGCHTKVSLQKGIIFAYGNLQHRQ